MVCTCQSELSYATLNFVYDIASRNVSECMKNDFVMKEI